MDKFNLGQELTWLYEYPTEYLGVDVLKNNVIHLTPALDILDNAHDLFWNESLWLPPQMSWSDFEPDGTHKAQASELLWGIPAGILIMVMRMIFIRCFSNPLGKYLQFKETSPQPPVLNAVLEREFLKHSKILPDHHVIQKLAEETNWSPRQVERWWRKRKLQGKASALQRWNEAMWATFIYTALYLLAIYCVYDKPWLSEPRKIWENYTNQDHQDSVTLLYMMQLGFYLALLATLFELRHKDFREIALHHVVSLLLISLSWCVYASRIGVLIMLIHDSTSGWLHAAKVAKYMKLQRLCDVLFCIFALQWFFARFYVFPFVVIRATIFEGPIELKMEPEDLPPTYYVINGLLLTLQLYHFAWFRHILIMLKSLVVKGQIEKDSRSDTEVESSEDEKTK